MYFLKPNTYFLETIACIAKQMEIWTEILAQWWEIAGKFSSVYNNKTVTDRYGVTIKHSRKSHMESPVEPLDLTLSNILKNQIQ